MANVTIPATGTGTATPIVRTDTVTGAEYQVVKIDVGGAGATVPVTGTFPVRSNDGTNSETVLFDADTGAGAQWVKGVSLRKFASGGSVEYGTTADPVNVADAGGSLTVDGTVTANAGSGTFGTNVAQVAGTTTDTNSGNKSAGTLRVVLATDQPQLTNALKVDGSAVTQPVSGSVSLIPLTAGGLTIKHLISAASTNATNAKASAGQLYGWSIGNTNAAIRYVKLHNNSGTPTAGTGVVLTIMVPASGGSNFSTEQGIAFGTGIAFTTVTGTADADTTGVGANDLVIELYYK